MDCLDDNEKVILVANEKEVGSVELPENYLLKLFISAQESVDWPKIEKTGILGLEQANKDDKPDLDEIKQRSKLLSDENMYYHQVKEKLVGIVTSDSDFTKLSNCKKHCRIPKVGT